MICQTKLKVKKKIMVEDKEKGESEMPLDATVYYGDRDPSTGFLDAFEEGNKSDVSDKEESQTTLQDDESLASEEERIGALVDDSLPKKENESLEAPPITPPFEKVATLAKPTATEGEMEDANPVPDPGGLCSEMTALLENKSVVESDRNHRKRSHSDTAVCDDVKVKSGNVNLH